MTVFRKNQVKLPDFHSQRLRNGAEDIVAKQTFY